MGVVVARSRCAYFYGRKRKCDATFHIHHVSQAPAIFLWRACPFMPRTGERTNQQCKAYEQSLIRQARRPGSDGGWREFLK